MLKRYLAIVVLVSLVVLVAGCGKVEPTDTPVLPTATALPPTVTPVSPTNTATPEPSNTATLEPTDTVTPEPSSTPTPALGIGSAATREADGMDMVYVPGGTFLMGSEGGNRDEHPVHSVTLDSFWIDRTEVSNAQYTLCIESGECRASYYADDDASNRDEYPVVGVSWQDAADYCAWAGARLPTEAEWEYAARGPEGNIYSWGDTFDGTRLNFCDANCSYDWKDTDYDDGYERTSPVKDFESGASWCGALNMAGNVWEWVADRYDAYPSTAQINPTGPDVGDHKVLRGSSWDSLPGIVRAAPRRYYHTPDDRDYNVGLRCVVEPGR